MTTKSTGATVFSVVVPTRPPLGILGPAGENDRRRSQEKARKKYKTKDGWSKLPRRRKPRVHPSTRTRRVRRRLSRLRPYRGRRREARQGRGAVAEGGRPLDPSRRGDDLPRAQGRLRPRGVRGALLGPARSRSLHSRERAAGWRSEGPRPGRPALRRARAQGLGDRLRPAPRPAWRADRGRGARAPCAVLGAAGAAGGRAAARGLALPEPPRRPPPVHRRGASGEARRGVPLLGGRQGAGRPATRRGGARDTAGDRLSEEAR